MGRPGEIHKHAVDEDIVDQLLLKLKQRQIWYQPFELLYPMHLERVALYVYFDCRFNFGTQTSKDYVSP